MSNRPEDEPRDRGEITVSVVAPEWVAALPEAEALARDAAEAALAAAVPGIGPAGIAVVLADDALVRSLNRDWRGKDAATNVLSFPAAEIVAGARPPAPPDGMPLELGDVVLARETCVAEATAQRKPLAHHVNHLIVHGVLHLLGYDHAADDEAARMEGLETRVLASLGVPDPYAA